ncbi:hypothetical protein PSTG_13510 [Puccinia striiformis f. sp. tritici PST-78]|uniref:Tet-like 2OG-Fe(II) oxygenase domain-containing protein n=1 Tax=Puccinia striiformis f. sp. tritici PST-78 TaxID=1165861 RepID=A0A0L0V1Q8_9BASI|nr:hypothetical protein PSTG_13510 [Puccinia striiformis f. sp. tritici PST-78]
MNQTDHNPSLSETESAVKPPDLVKQGEVKATPGENNEKRKRSATRHQALKRKNRKKNYENQLETISSKENAFPSSKKFRHKVEVAVEREKRSKEESSTSGSDQKNQTSTIAPLIPRAPTEEENANALNQVESRFCTCHRDFVQILDQRKSKIICAIQFLKLESLADKQRDDFDFLCAFFHRCKTFILSTASEGLCGDVTSAIGWCKDTIRLEIVHSYRNEVAIEANQHLYTKLMEDSERAGSILWETFSTFANVAADNTRKHMKKLAESGLVSSLAFPSNSFYNDLHLDEDDDSNPPLSFAMVIPTLKSTGKIGSESEGHRVDNGQFVFPDLKQAIQFPPDTICLMIFRAQEYAHGTLHATEFEDSTRLKLCIQAPI